MVQVVRSLLMWGISEKSSTSERTYRLLPDRVAKAYLIAAPPTRQWSETQLVCIPFP
jgi:hypothetical protein